MKKNQTARFERKTNYDISKKASLLIFEQLMLSYFSIIYNQKGRVMGKVDELKMKYLDANAWQMGDSPELANELAALIEKGIKTASCGSYASYQKEEFAPRIGSYNIILDGQDVPVCVTRLVSMQLVCFCDVTAELARKEGEGDLSLEYWQREHQRFFTQEGHFSEDMELIMEEFEVVEVL